MLCPKLLKRYLDDIKWLIQRLVLGIIEAIKGAVLWSLVCAVSGGIITAIFFFFLMFIDATLAQGIAGTLSFFRYGTIVSMIFTPIGATISIVVGAVLGFFIGFFTGFFGKSLTYIDPAILMKKTFYGGLIGMIVFGFIAVVVHFLIDTHEDFLWITTAKGIGIGMTTAAIKVSITYARLTDKVL